MNYIWTVQEKKVFNIIKNKGQYYPDFNISHNGNKWNEAYKLVLESFNSVNKSNYKGLVFGFVKSSGESFKDVDELYKYFMDNPEVTSAFDFWNEKYVILQLAYDENFNFIPVDFNDFIQIMPPIWDTSIKDAVCKNIKQGEYNGAYTLESFIQVHLPYIKDKNVINVYGNFDKKNSDSSHTLTIFDK